MKNHTCQITLYSAILISLTCGITHSQTQQLTATVNVSGPVRTNTAALTATPPSTVMELESKLRLEALIGSLLRKLPDYSECASAVNSVYINNIKTSFTRSVTENEFKNMTDNDIIQQISAVITNTSYKTNLASSPTPVPPLELAAFQSLLLKLFEPRDAVLDVFTKYASGNPDVCELRNMLAKGANDPNFIFAYLSVKCADNNLLKKMNEKSAPASPPVTQTIYDGKIRKKSVSLTNSYIITTKSNRKRCYTHTITFIAGDEVKRGFLRKCKIVKVENDRIILQSRCGSRSFELVKRK